MKPFSILLVGVTLIGCSSDPVEDNSTANESSPANEIPKKFHGVFDESQARCSFRYSDSRISIYKDSIEYWESAGEVTGDVVREGDNRIQVSLNGQGEGETWTADNSYELSEDGQKLTIKHGDYQFERIRCP